MGFDVVKVEINLGEMSSAPMVACSRRWNSPVNGAPLCHCVCSPLSKTVMLLKRPARVIVNL